MNKLSPEETSTLLKTLQNRFKKNIKRHPELDWNKIQTKLEADPKKIMVTQPNGAHRRRTRCH